MKNLQVSYIFGTLLVCLTLYTQAQPVNSKEGNYKFSEQNITINSTSKWALNLDVTRLSHADEYTNYSLYYNVWATFNVEGLRGRKSFNVANLFSYNILGGTQSSGIDAISEQWSFGDVNVTAELAVLSTIVSDPQSPYSHPIVVRWIIQRQVNLTYPQGAEVRAEQPSVDFAGRESEPMTPGLFNLFANSDSDRINVHGEKLDVSPIVSVANSHVIDGYNVTNKAVISPNAAVSLEAVDGVYHYRLEELTVVESVITLLKV